MALDPTALAPLIAAQLQAEFAGAMPPSYLPVAQAQWLKLGTAIANALIPYLIASTTVNPGIPTAGSPSAQVTVGPGTIS